ncbi:MAG: AAA family ATPase [Candidatus Hydrothermarchaeaceae archaeon]
MIITIGGPIGSGKTTVAKAIADKFGFTHISAGVVFREMADEKGITLEEFSKLAEENHEFDRELDKRQIELAKKAENAVIDGRLSGWLIDADLKVWLKASLETRAKRVSGRDGKDYGKALEDVRARGDSELLRYREIYDIDLRDLAPYDIVINTAPFSAEEVTGIMEKIVSYLR